MADLLLGVDVGGTKIMAGAVDSSGKVTGEPVTVATGGSDDKELIFGRIAEAIQTVISRTGTDRIKGIGMGVTGPLDIEKGLILECPQLPTMHFFPLRERIEKLFRLPVVMDNDANALLLGESIFGAGRGHKIVLGFTLGTGLGCALVVNGRLFSGTNGMAGEVWPSPEGDGTIEDSVSGNGVSNYYFKLTGDRKSSRQISDLARSGDKMAIETWKMFGKKLAFSIAWCINMTDPGIVVLGGSIANSLDLFSDPMENELRRFICPVPAKSTRVVKASLGDMSGFIGSAALLNQ
jgi:glucokinase